MAALLRWTFHPLVDVGIATLCAMTNRTAPEAITVEDLEVATAELAAAYFNGVMNSFLTCVFMNSGYVNPTMKDDRRKEYEERILRAYRRATSNLGLICAFSGESAVDVVHRGQIPMLTGEETLNFYPAIRGGLPIAGAYLTAIQALPMGSKRVEGKLFAVHSDSPDLTVALARTYVRDNRRLIALGKAGRFAKESGSSSDFQREIGMGDKYPDSKSPASLITWDLMEVLKEGKLFRSGKSQPVSITCYWLSNSGQGPSLDLFHIPSNLIRFLVEASRAPYADSWNLAVHEAWRPVGASPDETPEKKAKKASKKAVSVGGPGRSRNNLLDDLVRMFRDGTLSRSAARKFIQMHLVRYRKDESGKHRIERVEWIDWKLTELFLKEVLGMTQERINRIREFADKLAEHIAATNDRKLFRGVVYATRSYELRSALTRAQQTEARDHDRLLFGLADYLEVFEADEVVRLGDWSLTRDLISIRLIENLHAKRFFEKNADLLDESTEREAS